jgi:hypothetical protein
MPAQRRGSGKTGGAPDPRSEIQKLLRKGKKTWGDSKEEAKTIGRVDVPDSNYEVDLQGCEFKVKDGTPYIVRRHVIVDGDHADKVVVDTLWFDLENARRTAFIYQWLELLGEALPEDPGELFDIIERINEESYQGKVRVYHWGDNNRLGVDLLEAYEPEEGGAGSETASEEAPAEEAPAEDAEKPLEEMELEELLKICEEDSIEVPKGRRNRAPGKDAVIAAIKKWDEENPEAAAPAEEAASEEAPAEGGDDDAKALLEDTAAFCKAQDIKLTKAEAGDIEAMKKKISKYEYVSNELEKDDVELLGELGLEELVVQPEAPKEEPPKRTSRRRGGK